MMAVGAKPQLCYNQIGAINNRVIMMLQCIMSLTLNWLHRRPSSRSSPDVRLCPHPTGTAERDNLCLTEERNKKRECFEMFFKSCKTDTKVSSYNNIYMKVWCEYRYKSLV